VKVDRIAAIKTTPRQMVNDRAVSRKNSEQRSRTNRDNRNRGGGREAHANFPLPHRLMPAANIPAPSFKETLSTLSTGR
jgi:hypothetical protein